MSYEMLTVITSYSIHYTKLYDDDTPFCVMQHLGGGALDLTHGPRQSPAQVLRWLAPVARTLDRIHRRGWVHRDVKPDNILIHDGHALVADFGIGKALAATDGATVVATMAGTSVGTPAYMSPEQASYNFV